MARCSSVTTRTLYALVVGLALSLASGNIAAPTVAADVATLVGSGRAHLAGERRLVAIPRLAPTPFRANANAVQRGREPLAVASTWEPSVPLFLLNCAWLC
jgi:hypothetical protein